MALGLAASAQPTADDSFLSLPGPLTSSDLIAMEQRLRLSNAQADAIEAIHDRYKIEYRSLVDRHAAFLRTLPPLHDRKGLDGWSRAFNSALQAAIALDAGFFDHVALVLAEPQLPRLELSRLARERVRYRDMHKYDFVSWPDSSLAAIVRSLDLTPEERDLVAPFLDDYERNATAALRKLSTTLRNTYVEFMLAMIDQGSSTNATESTVSLMSRRQAPADDVLELNIRSSRSLAALLSPERGRHLKLRYYERAFVSLRRLIWSLRTLDACTLALANDDLDDDQIAAVRMLVLDIGGQLDATIESAVRVVREAERGAALDRSADDAERYRSELRALKAKAVETDQRGREVLEQIIGSELVTRYEDVVQLRRQRRPGGRYRPGAIVEPMAPPRDDPFVPHPIPAQDLAYYEWILGLTGDQHARLREAHDAYTRIYSSDAAPQVARAVALSRSVMDPGDDAALDLTTAVLEARRESMIATQRVDEEFFAMLVDLDPAADRLQRLIRARSRELHTPPRRLSTVSTNACTVDLGRLLFEHGASLPSPWAYIAGFDEEVTRLVRARFEERLLQHYELTRYSIELARLRMSEAAADQLDELMREADQTIDASTIQLNEYDARISKVNRQALETILVALPPDRSDVFARSYARRAYPNVFRDPAALHLPLQEAMALTDIAEEQRDALSSLASEYEAAYDGITSRMVSACIEAEGLPERSGSDWDQHLRATETMVFDRNELNMRTARRMSAVLTARQIQAIGSLPEPRDAASSIAPY